MRQPLKVLLILWPLFVGQVTMAESKGPEKEEVQVEQPKDSSDHKVMLFRGKVSRTNKKAKIPKALVREVERQFVRHFRVVHPESPLEDSEVRVNIPRRYLSLTAEFVAYQPGVLVKNTEYRIHKGGGIIDLADLVVGGFGGFNLRMRVEKVGGGGEVLTPSHVRVYYVSEAKKRRINGDNYGVGCDRWMDVTKLFRKKLNNKGLYVYSKGQRYLSILAGTYYFVHFDDGTLYLSSLGIIDRRYENIQCKRQ